MDPPELPQENEGTRQGQDPGVLAEAQFSAFLLHKVPQCFLGKSIGSMDPKAYEFLLSLRLWGLWCP